MSRPVVIVLALLVAVFAVAYWQFLDRKPPVSLAAVAPPISTKHVVTPPSTRVGAPGSGQSPQSLSVADNDRPFVEVRPNLERRARAGDGHAAWRLGMALANCNGYVPISDEEIESSVIDTFARGITVRGSTPAAMLQKLKLAAAQKRRDCRNVSGLAESDFNNEANKKALYWMELGASLGNADAQAMYATLAFAQFDGRNALADAEQIRQRKRLALEYLERSLAQGDAFALLQLSKQHTEGLLFPADAEVGYRYLYAFSLTPRASDFVPGYLEMMLALAAQDLDPIAQGRAQEAGRRLATCCMSKAGEQP